MGQTGKLGINDLRYESFGNNFRRWRLAHIYRTSLLRACTLNPVRRRLGGKPERWQWSSFRAYAYGNKALFR